MITKEELREAIRCCRNDDCENCPLQREICDELRVDMVDLPEDLVALVEDALEDKRNPVIVCPHCGKRVK